MRQAISYVSTAATELSTPEIKSLLEQTTKKNNSLGITGFLICSERSFFQLLEGEKEIISELFSSIRGDSRHHNIIKIVDSTLKINTNRDDYYASFISENTEFPEHQIERYLQYTQGLDRKSQNAVKRILEAMIL